MSSQIKALMVASGNYLRDEFYLYCIDALMGIAQQLNLTF